MQSLQFIIEAAQDFTRNAVLRGHEKRRKQLQSKMLK